MKLRNLIAATLIGSMAFSTAPAYAFSSGSSGGGGTPITDEFINELNARNEVREAYAVNLERQGWERNSDADSLANIYLRSTPLQREDMEWSAQRINGEYEIYHHTLEGYRDLVQELISIPHEGGSKGMFGVSARVDGGFIEVAVLRSLWAV